MSAGSLLWTPSAATCDDSRLTAYMRWLEVDHGLHFADYAELWAWSTTDIAAFWQSIWDYFEVQAETPARAALGRRAMPGTEWFPGAELNYAENVFRGKSDDALALIHASENRSVAELTWGELRRQTAVIAEGLRRLGVMPGDRVAAYLPNTAEAVIGFLACASIGATWASCSPDFGARAVIDRFSQITPKVLLAVDGYRYGGKAFDRIETVAEIRAAVPGIEQIVLLGYLEPEPGLEKLQPALRWEELATLGAGAELQFAQLPFDHPLWILSSSGTTGLPKPIVQGQGGILLEHLKMVHLHFDLKPGDRLFWFTTTGWMMWNLLVSGLLTDAAIVLYDGSPGYPNLEVLWELAETTELTCFGTSAAFIASCMKAGIEPGRGRDLSRLRGLGSTGSPLSPDGFRWVYDEVKRDLWLFSMSGGTDVCTAFVGGVPTLPTYEGELQARALGAAIEAFTEDGLPVTDQVGELVLTEPLPSMPLYLWGDEDGSRLHESYFDLYPGIWRHGDWIELTSRGTAIISGRSDSTINRAGIRIGTSEIYRTVMAFPEVRDALVLDLPRPGTAGWIVLFVVLTDGAVLDDELSASIRARLRDECSPRHLPDEVRAVRDVPRTISGKLVEVPIKRILLGADPAVVASRESLANPSALDDFASLAQTDPFGVRTGTQ